LATIMRGMGSFRVAVEFSDWYASLGSAKRSGSFLAASGSMRQQRCSIVLLMR
jgi:hypothetical protein